MNRLFLEEKETPSLFLSKTHPYDAGNIVHDKIHLSPLAGYLIYYAEQMTSALDLGIAWCFKEVCRCSEPFARLGQYAR